MEIFYFIIVLGVLVTIHEYGHFLMARRAGIRVEAFSIGFGPKLFSIHRGETEFKVCLLPLGGYVKMWGEEPDDEHAGDPAAFTAKSVPARAGVVTAGPVMNILLACVLLPIVFFIGRNEPEFLSQSAVVTQVRPKSPAAVAGLQPGDRLHVVDGTAVATWEEVMDAMLLWSGTSVDITIERQGASRTYALHIPRDAPRVGMLGIEPPLFIGNEPVIDEIMPGGVAAAAGVRAGDRVVTLNGEPVADWQALADGIHANGQQPMTLTVDRAGAALTLTMQPEFRADIERNVIGIQRNPERASIPTVLRRHGVVGAIVRGEREAWRLGRLTVKFLGRLMTEPRAHYRSLGGPIQIAQVSVSAAKSGIAQLLYFAAFLSLQLGMLNLLPIPVLDGGHLFFLGIEAVRRRPVSPRVRATAQQVGMVILLSLLLIVTINDLDNLLGLRRWMDRLF